VWNKRCHALLVSYDGGAFSGFQRQPSLPTVQGALEEALGALGCKARIEGGGRTDAGVHARRQVVTFRTAVELPDDLAERLAPHLPTGLRVLAAATPPWSFHARFSAVGKVYRYRVAAVADPTDELRREAWVLPDPRGLPDLDGPVLALDEEAMRGVLEALTGRHDFTNLVHPRAEGERKRLLARAELHATPWEGGGAVYELGFAAPGFIRHQIRNIVGVAVTAGLGRLAPGTIERLLSGEGERWRGVRAPGRGLYLWDIQYRHGEDPFRSPQSG